MACIAVLIYVILLSRGVLYSDEDAHEENNRPAILMIACGCCFLVHTLCWIKATFQLEGAEDGATYPLPEDTYTLLMCNDAFG